MSGKLAVTSSPAAAVHVSNDSFPFLSSLSEVEKGRNHIPGIYCILLKLCGMVSRE